MALAKLVTVQLLSTALCVSRPKDNRYRCFTFGYALSYVLSLHRVSGARFDGQSA